MLMYRQSVTFIKKNFMPPPESSFITLLRTKILPGIHLVALLVSALGLTFKMLHYDGGDALLMLGLSALSAIYFLMAFTLVQVPTTTKPNLYSFILYKLIYIASSVTVIGILFAILKMNGGDQMLLIGCGGLGVALLFAAVLIGTNRDNMIVLKTPFFRGFAILLLGVYFMQQLSMF